MRSRDVFQIYNPASLEGAASPSNRAQASYPSYNPHRGGTSGSPEGRFQSQSHSLYFSPGGSYRSPQNVHHGPSQNSYRSPSQDRYHSPSQNSYRSPSPYWSSSGFYSPGESPLNRSIGSPGYYHFPVGSPSGQSSRGWHDANNNDNAQPQRKRRSDDGSASPMLKSSKSKKN